MSPSYALEFGLALSALSFVLLAGVVNVLTATLALVGNLFYVLVYTRWLKRSTPQNIVIGGAAGAIPPLVGWAAATGNLTLPAISLFLIVFFWTPPHFWALALLIKRNYAEAGIPMLPVVRGERETVKQILLYSFVMVAVTVVPFLWGTLGLAYLVAALLLGAAFIWLAVQLARHTTPRQASLLFHSSLLYLALRVRRRRRRRGRLIRDARSRDRAQEPPLGLGALRALLPDRRRHVRDRVHLPRGRLDPASGPRGRTSHQARGTVRRRSSEWRT